MPAETVNQMVDRLVNEGALTAQGFAARLGAPLKDAETNPYWTTYTFELAQGPFAGGQLRLHAAGEGALLILEPRDPPGLGRGDINRAALGTSLGMRPNPDISPEGVLADYYEKDGVQVVLQWLVGSRRLRSLVLEWPGRPITGEPEPMADEDDQAA